MFFQAPFQAARSAEIKPRDKEILDYFAGALFLGLPNRGLDYEFLPTVVQGQPNYNLTRFLDPESAELKTLQDRFTMYFSRKKELFFGYYEMRETPLAKVSYFKGVFVL